MLGLIPSTKYYKLTIRNATKWSMYLRIFFSLWYESTILCSSSSNVYEDLFMLLLCSSDMGTAKITLNVMYVLNHDIAFFTL